MSRREVVLSLLSLCMLPWYRFCQVHAEVLGGYDGGRRCGTVTRQILLLSHPHHPSTYPSPHSGPSRCNSPFSYIIITSLDFEGSKLAYLVMQVS